MAFDLSTAKPVSGGFDLSTATPVGQSLAQSNPSEYNPSSPEYQAKYGAVSGMSGAQRFAAGAGKSIYDIGRGAGQLVGAESYQDAANSRQIDAPLMATGAGKAGAITGGIVSTLPAMIIPGANTVVGAGLVGGAYGLLQPATSLKEKALNTAVGGAAGAASQYVGGKVANWAQGKLAARATASADEASINSARDAVLKTSQEAGYVVPPTAVNENVGTATLESMAGKAALRQRADAINQTVTDKIIRGDLGIASNQPITRETINEIRSNAGKIYGQVAGVGKIASDAQYKSDIAALTNIGADLEKAAPGIGAQAGDKVKGLADALFQPEFDAKDAVGLFKYLNNRAKATFQAAFASGNPESLDLARAQRAGADAMGDLIRRNLATTGNQALADSWDAARTTIAKTYTAEAALRGNHINALNLAAQLRADKPLSGGFKAVADFADQFGEFSRLPKSGVGVSKLGAVVAGGGAATAIATGHPMLAAGMAAGPAASYGIGKAILSDVGQNALAQPSYAPGMIGTGTINALQYLGRRGPALAIPASNALVQSVR